MYGRDPTSCTGWMRPTAGSSQPSRRSCRSVRWSGGRRARPLRQTIMRRHRQPWPSRRLPRQVVRSSPLTHSPIRADRVACSPPDPQTAETAGSSIMSIDLRAWAEDQWMVQIACLDRKLKQWLIEHVGTIRSELTRPEQTTLERILVDRIVISRLQVFHASKVSRESETSATGRQARPPVHGRGEPPGTDRHPGAGDAAQASVPETQVGQGANSNHPPSSSRVPRLPGLRPQDSLMPEAPGAPGNRAFAATGAKLLDRQSARGHSRRDHAAVLRDARSGRIGAGDSSGAWERRSQRLPPAMATEMPGAGTVVLGPCAARGADLEADGRSSGLASRPIKGTAHPEGRKAAAIEAAGRSSLEDELAEQSPRVAARGNPTTARGPGRADRKAAVVPGRQGLPRGHEEPPDPDGRQAAKTAAETPEQAVGRIVTTGTGRARCPGPGRPRLPGRLRGPRSGRGGPPLPAAERWVTRLE